MHSSREDESRSSRDHLQVPVQRRGGSLSPRRNDLRRSVSSSQLSGDLVEFPEAKSPYNGITHGVRRMVPHELACRMGCHGAKCKYDNSDCWERDQMAVKGLFSHWVTDDILATARPRDSLIKNGNLIHRMKKAGIRSIFNLQSRNEHKDCGEGVLRDTGFSYDPNDFTSENIYYYNFELEDYSVASTLKMLDMVKVLAFAVTEGKAAIHCHAGLGRTGLFIACYLIYAQRMGANEAIHFIREKRPGAVQMNDQIQAVKDFEHFLRPLRIIYSKTAPVLNELTSQSPNTEVLKNLIIYSTGFNLNTFLHRQKLFLHGNEQKKLKYIPKIIFVCGEQLKRLGRRWKEDGMSENVQRKIEKLSNEFAKNVLESTRKSGDKKRSYDEINPNIAIARALATNNFPKKIMNIVEEYQHLINENNEGLDDLVNEEDPFVLSALIWTWIVELKEPILRDQELNILLKEYSNSSFTSNFNFEMDKINWKGLDKGTLYTINYLIEIIHELLPLERDLEDNLICHLIECLTHTKLKYEHDEYQIKENDDVVILNSAKKMQKKQFQFLHKIIKELCQKPFKLTNKALGKSRFKNETTKRHNYDYEEDVAEENEYSYQRDANGGNKSSNKFY